MMTAHAMRRGAIRRPEPTPDRYHLFRTTPAALGADITQPYSLRPYVTPIGSQGPMGSCVGWAAGTCAEMAARILGRLPVELHAGWLYYWARVKRGWAHLDSGCIPEDVLDLLRLGAPGMATAYVANYTWTPPPALEEAPREDYVLSYRNFTATDGIAAFCGALQAKLPVVIAMVWPDEFMRPTGPGNCVLPSGVAIPPTQFGHAVAGIEWIPGLGAVCQNSWSEDWTPHAGNSPWGLRPGEFILPMEYMTGPNAMVWGYYAVSGEPVVVPPPPPTPTGRTTADFQRDAIAGIDRYAAMQSAWTPAGRYRREALAGARRIVEGTPL